MKADMASISEENRDHWIGLAKRTAKRINVAWWLERLSAPLVILSTAGACVLLMLRRDSPDTPLWQYAVGVGIALGVLALGAWLAAKRKFETPEQSLVRIEATMKLRNSLSAARAGVTAWPDPQMNVESGVRWNWPRLLVPTLGAILLLSAGLFVPVSALPVAKKDSPEEPQAWKKIESDLDQLAKDAVIDEAYIEDMKKKVEELRAQKEEDWFSHSSLEASDSLKKEHQAELKRMERELERADKAMGNLQKAAGGGEGDPAKMANEFEQALQGLQNGAMKPNPDLLNQLKSLDPKNLGQITPEQMQQLKENLGKANEAMKGMQGQGEGQGDWEDQLQADGDGQGDKPGQGQGSGDGEGEGQDGEGAGKGGVGRGPGHAPGVLGKEANKTETGALTGLDAKDLSRATPGDLLQLQDGEHQIDKSPSKASNGGGTQATGQGGDRVWKESLDPDEQRAMKKFFDER